ncbi:TraR/DksA family transcriptional regulator [Prosthecobacter sp.]|uniref:TraR/DksA family transcriptional regulator n=1 Tax=Prosthecobacter sp. TaxID=1965333 RepID=UPI003784095B
MNNTPSTLSPAVPRCWAWHYHKLQTLLDELLGKRSDHQAEVSEPIEPHSMDLADSATDEFDHELALGLLAQEDDALLEVVSAINRIMQGTYGICEDTGRPIPAARLRAVPWARRTVEAQSRAEREGLPSGARLGPLASAQASAPHALSELEEPDREEFPEHDVARHQRETDLRAIIEGTAQI